MGEGGYAARCADDRPNLGLHRNEPQIRVNVCEVSDIAGDDRVVTFTSAQRDMHVDDVLVTTGGAHDADRPSHGQRHHRKLHVG